MGIKRLRKTLLRFEFFPEFLKPGFILDQRNGAEWNNKYVTMERLVVTLSGEELMELKASNFGYQE